MENRENSRNFSILKKKNRVLGNVIMKAHAKFQEANSIGNTQKSRETLQWRDYFWVKKRKNGENTGNFSKIDEPNIWVA